MCLNPSSCVLALMTDDKDSAIPLHCNKLIGVGTNYKHTRTKGIRRVLHTNVRKQ